MATLLLQIRNQTSVDRVNNSQLTLMRFIDSCTYSTNLNPLKAGRHVLAHLQHARLISVPALTFHLSTQLSQTDSIKTPY